MLLDSKDLLCTSKKKWNCGCHLLFVGESGLPTPYRIPFYLDYLLGPNIFPLSGPGFSNHYYHSGPKVVVIDQMTLILLH